MTSAPSNETLPPAVTRYFAAVRRGAGTHDAIRSSATGEVFAADARVTDDGRTYRGIDEVRAWLSGPAIAYEVTYTELSVEVTEKGVVVLTRLQGNFPGGVVALCNSFELDSQGQIAVLEISA